MHVVNEFNSLIACAHALSGVSVVIIIATFFRKVFSWEDVHPWSCLGDKEKKGKSMCDYGKYAMIWSITSSRVAP